MKLKYIFVVLLVIYTLCSYGFTKTKEDTLEPLFEVTNMDCIRTLQDKKEIAMTLEKNTINIANVNTSGKRITIIPDEEQYLMIECS